MHWKTVKPNCNITSYVNFVIYPHLPADVTVVKRESLVDKGSNFLKKIHFKVKLEEKAFKL